MICLITRIKEKRYEIHNIRYSHSDCILYRHYFYCDMGLKGKSNRKKTTEDYFLASRSLPWWAIGASLIAANISAEQIIAMSGDGYVIGLAIATYEWTAAIALIVMAKYFLPIFLREKIYTMPQFLEKRFDSRVKVVLAIFGWLSMFLLT